MDDSEKLKEAVETLKNGGLVAFPTETVYGLGADAANDKALERLYAIKNRPSSHPSIVHLASFDQLSHWCSEIPDSAEMLAALFWPGPLTMVLKKRVGVSDLLTGGQNTVAIRMPAHPTARALLTESGLGIAAPSANRFGRLSPTSAEDVREEFGDEILVLDGGACQVGIESTIIDLSADQPRILRPGMILESSIEVALAGLGLHMRPGAADTAPRVPGSLPSHYAPAKLVHLVETGQLEAVAKEFHNSGRKVALMCFAKPDFYIDLVYVMSKSPAVYAYALYRNLRKLDQSDVDVIVVERPPDELEWAPILDRLTRAAGPRDLEVENGT